MSETKDRAAELAHLREGARLMAQCVAIDTQEQEFSDAGLDKHAVDVSLWLAKIDELSERHTEEPELEQLLAEHAYLVGMAAPEDLLAMRKELAKERAG